jgi:RNA polymerase sigma-70 factor (ECF subfamily)
MLGKYVKQSMERFGLASTGAHEDIVQEILLGIHRKRNSFDSEQYFLPWMYAIARYKMVDYIRKNGRIVKTSVPIEDELENLEVVINHDLGAGHDIMALCQSLPPKQNQILRLVKIDGLSISEAAAKTGYSPNDIKINVHRALKTLQRQVTEAGDEN